MPTEPDPSLEISQPQLRCRYRALLGIKIFFRICAGLFGTGSFLGFCYWIHLFNHNEDRLDTELIFTCSLGLAFFGICTLAFAELIQVFLDIEENTRNTFTSLRNLNKPE